MNKRLITGIAVGGFLDVGASFALAITIGIVAASETVSPDSHRVLSFVELGIGFASSILGGYVAARIARGFELIAGTPSSWLCILMGILVIAFIPTNHSRLENIVLLLAGPLMGLAGGALARTRLQSKA